MRLKFITYLFALISFSYVANASDDGRGRVCFSDDVDVEIFFDNR